MDIGKRYPMLLSIDIQADLAFFNLNKLTGESFPPRNREFGLNLHSLSDMALEMFRGP
jgi:hypothetical protein